jgi:aerobic-type carbon monoxide dehydrogenase small subunit (CoxS/CutS family)
MTDKVDITLRINGRYHEISVEPRKTLVDAIREDCGLTGTHIGCEHGVCGACTVIIGGEAVRSCLMFAVQAHHQPIRTVEGLAKDGVLHPLQRAFIAHHGLQCGFCTPGFLMLAVHMLEQNAGIDDENMRDVLASNLCRCTGYQNIVAAVKAAQSEMQAKPAPVLATPPVGDAEPAIVAAPPEMLEQAETAHD